MRTTAPAANAFLGILSSEIAPGGNIVSAWSAATAFRR